MPYFETERLCLRPLHDGDAVFIAREIGNFNVSKNLARVPHPYTIDDAVDFLDWIKSYDDRSLMCGVEIKKTGQLVGIASYEATRDLGCSELGYWFAQQFWGRGFGHEAAKAIVYYAFVTAKLDQLVAGFHNDNPASGRILLDLGFAEVGQNHKFSKARGKKVPTTFLSLTRKSWLRIQ